MKKFAIMLSAFFALSFIPTVANAIVNFSPVTVTGGSLNAQVGVAFSYQIQTASAYTVTSYTATGLPSGLSLNTSTGVISGTPTTAGSFTVSLSASSSMGSGAANLGITVAKGTQTLSTSELPETATYGDGPYAFYAESSVGLPVSIVVSGPATLSNGSLSITGAGTVTVTASQAGNANYLAATTVVQSIVVAKASQRISMSGLPEAATYGDGPFTISAESSAGLPVSLSASGPATLSGMTLTVTGAGTVTVTAWQDGNANYLAAQTVTFDIEVAKASTSIEISAPPVAFDGNSKSATVQVTPEGLKVNVVYTYNGEEVVPTAVGSYTVTATVEDDNYEGSETATLLIGYELTTWGIHGAVDASSTSSIFPAGATVTLTPESQDDATYFFTRWMGDVPEGAELTNPLQITMDQSRTIVANFIADAAAPTDITLSPSYLEDSTVSGTVVGTLSAKDTDIGDSFTYTLVEGFGDTGNSRFTISGDQLVTNDTFSFGTDRTLSVRVCATDCGGKTFETDIPIHLLPASPAAQFVVEDTSVSSPSDVEILFRLSDIQYEAPYLTGRGINYPTDYVKSHPELFRVSEDAVNDADTSSLLSLIESSPYVGKIDEVPTTIKTILLIDNSASMGGALSQVREAAKLMVSRLLDSQQVAVYTFSGTMQLVQTFTSDVSVLDTAIDSIKVGSGTTDLNGSILSLVNDTTAWPDDAITIDSVNAGYLVVVTDGRDQAGLHTDDEVEIARDSHLKKIMMIGLATNGDELDNDGLSALANVGYWSATVSADLDTGAVNAAFADVQNSIEEEANSYYWFRYVSPKRGMLSHHAEVLLTGNTNVDYLLHVGETTAAYDFIPNGFADAERGVVVNPSVADAAGISGSVTIGSEGEIMQASTLYGLTYATYAWTPDNSRLLTVEDLSVDGSQAYVRLVPLVDSGTVQLTVRDSASAALAESNDTGIDSSVYEKTLTIVIGSGESTDTGMPWATAEDLANGWYDSDWFGNFDGSYFPWVWSVNNGWVWCDYGDEDNGLYYYDVSLGCWIWTCGSYYPWAYIYGSFNDWMWIVPDCMPGARLFYLVDADKWMTEAQMVSAAAE